MPDESPSQMFENSGARILSSQEGIGEALSATLNQHLPWPFRATTGAVRDLDGTETAIWGTVISTSGSKEEPTSAIIGADNAACVIDVHESLDVESLRSGYERVAAAKRLRKSAATQVPGIVMTTATLGVILARDAAVPLEYLAEELDRLNVQHADREWTDMVVVLSKGTINYAVQFPGEGLTGDFLPPAPGALERYSPPIYVVMVARPTGGSSFNKMCSFVLGHLAIFSPGAKLPNWAQILDGVPQDAITVTGYQFDLCGHLRAVPPEFYNDRYLPPRPHLIEDAAGNLLSTVRFLPWQDGGVIMFNGKLPLAPFLLFLGKDALRREGVVRRPEGEISNVLPISEADFQRMLGGIQSRSNMNVRVEPSSVVLQKMLDEGSSTPVIARLYVGVFRLRDVVFPAQGQREVFDKPFAQILEALASMRSASRRINELIADHVGAVTRGEIASLQGHTIHVSESIDDDLRKEFESFLNSSVRALKNGMQAITKALGKDIGFLFQKQQPFEDGVNDLKAGDPDLAAYLIESRKWTERLMDCRNAVEHEGWTVPKVSYIEDAGTVRAEEPRVDGEKASEFVTFMLDRLICFIEEVAAHCLVARMPSGIAVAEIPMAEREPAIPLRFRLTLSVGGMATWRLAYHQEPFDQC